jgi:S-DNA-T family DNA segregation ATPase FtsK/SpoIIIE
MSHLLFPRRDVEELNDVLRDPKIGGYNEDIPLIDRTSAVILREYSRLLRAEGDAEVLFYYSGHGKPSDLSRKLFLFGQDTTVDDLLITGIPFSTIIDLKDNFGIRSFTAILDCCYAGLAPEVKGSEDDQLKALAGGQGVFFSARQILQGWPKKTKNWAMEF